jgi:hypothetical protein
MALVLADRVQEYSTTTGTGTLTLSGAYAGFQTFAAGIGNGNTCYYTITSDTNQWEVGIGTVGVGTLERTTLISSSTGSTIDFVGTLTAFVTLPAEQAVVQNAAGVVTGYPITVTDNVFTLQDNVDPTKQAQFQLSGINTGTTYTYTLPNSSGTLAGTNIAQNWTLAQTFAAGSNTLGSSAGVTTTGVGTGATTTGLTKTVNVGTGGVSGSTTNIAIGSSVSGATSTTTMNGTTNFLDTGFTLQDNADTTKQAQFQLVNIPTGTTTTYTLPAGVANAATLIDAQTVQNITGAKTFAGIQTFSGVSGNFCTGANGGTVNVSSGATVSGQTKIVNLGTGGASGSTTNITVGTNVSGSTSTTLMNGVTKFQVYTVATLPSASTSGIGATAFVSDALAPTFGSTVVTGGAVAVPVYSDGTNWKVG